MPLQGPQCPVTPGALATLPVMKYLCLAYGDDKDLDAAVKLVTADGRVLQVSASEHSDLFWAIRGGGGNFGIVTSLEFRLHPIETILGGTLYLPPTAEAIGRVIALTRDAPDELTTISLLMRVPPSSEAHGSLHGQLSLMVMLVWAGDLEAGQRALTALRALSLPMGDAVHPMPLTAMYEVFALAAAPIANVSRAFLANTSTRRRSTRWSLP